MNVALAVPCMAALNVKQLGGMERVSTKLTGKWLQRHVERRKSTSDHFNGREQSRPCITAHV